MNKSKIIIRKARQGDEKGIAEMINDGLNRKKFEYLGGNKPFSKKRIERLRDSLSAKKKKDYQFVAIDKEKEKIVGSMSFHFNDSGRTRHRGSMGWSVHPDYFGQGIATALMKRTLREAKEKGFKRAEAEMAIKNTASVKLAKKFGFKVEGVKKKGLMLDNGKYADTYMVGKIF